MITIKTGNLLLEQTEALVNPVNCVGVGKKGLALVFKDEYPENYIKYQQACKQGLIKIGMVHGTIHIGSRTTHIINFPTKRHWRNSSKIEDIHIGLKALILYIQQQRIASISIPALGCGNGGLLWFDVKPLIITALTEVPEVHAIIFEPLE